MSKLEDKYTVINPSGETTGYLTDNSKQQLKDLMLELIGEIDSKQNEGSVFAYNESLRKKVQEL